VFLDAAVPIERILGAAHNAAKLGGHPMTKKVFISYVSEDALQANWIAEELRAVGVDVWLDRTRLKGGDVWREELSRAIIGADHFIACFSPRWVARTRSVAFEELQTALFEAGKRDRDANYLLPIKLDICDVPDQQVTATLRLSDLHFVSFSGRSLWTALRDVCVVLGAGPIRVDRAEPLAPGLPSRLSITNGAIIVEQTKPTIPALIGVERQIMHGELFRAFDNTIRLHVTVRTPVQAVQALDKTFGLAEIATVTKDAYVNTGRSELTRFIHTHSFTLPRGTLLHPLFFGIGTPTEDSRVTVETHFGIAVEPKSIVGVVDVFITTASKARTLQQRQWAIMQAAYTRAELQ